MTAVRVDGKEMIDLFWQIVAFGALAFLVIVLIFAVIEPGPLQQPRTFGGKAHADGHGQQGQEESHSSPHRPE